MPFGEILQRLMEERDITVAELSRRTGINKSTLYSYQRRNTRKPDPAYLGPIADALNVTINQLLGVEDLAAKVADLSERAASEPAVLEEKVGNLAGSTSKALQEWFSKKHDGEDVQPVPVDLISKYECLDEHGKYLVDTILDIEYERCTKV